MSGSPDTTTTDTTPTDVPPTDPPAAEAPPVTESTVTGKPAEITDPTTNLPEGGLPSNPREPYPEGSPEDPEDIFERIHGYRRDGAEPQENRNPNVIPSEPPPAAA
jgi:hypothetical protein